MCEAEGDETCKGGMGNAPEANETYGALWVGSDSAELWTAEEKRSPVVGGPLESRFKF